MKVPSQFSINTRRIAAVVLALATAYAIAKALLPRDPVIVADSGGYINWSSYRSLGYPVFLKLVGVSWVPPVQALSFAIALAWLSWEVFGLTRSILFTSLLSFAIAVNPEVMAFHVSVLTESVYVTLLLLILASLVRFTRDPHFLWLVLCSLFVGLSGTVRPTGCSMIAITFVAVLMLLKQLKSSLVLCMLAATLPAIVLIGVERSAHSLINGDGNSLTARVFFGRAGLVEAPPRATMPSDDPASRLIAQALEVEYAPVRALIRSSPDTNIRQKLVLTYEACLGIECSEDLRARTGLEGRAFDKIALRLALERIARAPLEYLWLSWTHYRSLWTVYSQSHPDLAPAFVEFIARHRPLPYESIVSNLTADFPVSRVALVARPIFMTIGIAIAIVTALGLLLVVRGRAAPVVAVAALSAFVVQSNFIFTALLVPGIPRFALALWPAMMTSLLFAAWAIFQRCREQTTTLAE